MRSEFRHSGVQFCSGHTCNYPHIACKEVGQERACVCVCVCVDDKAASLYSNVFEGGAGKEDRLYINAGQAKTRNTRACIYMLVNESGCNEVHQSMWP